MKKKIITAITAICLTGLVFSSATFIQAATTKESYSAEAKISYNKAKKIALKKVGGGTVREIDLDYENEALVYEVEVKYNGIKYEVDVDALTGEVVKYKSGNTTKSSSTKQSSTSSSQKKSTSDTAKITFKKAKEIAIKKVGGGTVKEIELDYENGLLVYEIEVKYKGVEYNINVDASTGKIVKYKIDD